MAPGDAHPYLAPFYVVFYIPCFMRGIFCCENKIPADGFGGGGAW